MTILSFSMSSNHRDKGLEVLAAAINAIVRVELHLRRRNAENQTSVGGDGQAFNEIRACFQPLIEPTMS